MKIISPSHTMFAALILRDQLVKLGYPSTIVNEIDYKDDSIYFIYQSAGLKRLPKRYVVLQTEIATSHWFNSTYLRTLVNAMAVWDYSELNIPRYSRLNKNIAIVTPGLKHVEHNGKDITFLFYGWIQGSKRRQSIVSDLKSRYNLMVVENKLTTEMWDILKRTRVVINIHYYDNSPLELYRLHESISHGCEVWLHDERRLYEDAKDNLEEIKVGLKVAGI